MHEDFFQQMFSNHKSFPLRVLHLILQNTQWKNPYVDGWADDGTKIQHTAGEIAPYWC